MILNTPILYVRRRKGKICVTVGRCSSPLMSTFCHQRYLNTRLYFHIRLHVYKRLCMSPRKRIRIHGDTYSCRYIQLRICIRIPIDHFEVSDPRSPPPPKCPTHITTLECTTNSSWREVLHRKVTNWRSYSPFNISEREGFRGSLFLRALCRIWGRCGKVSSQNSIKSEVS